MNYQKHYMLLGAMFVLHLIAMYILMYAMVDTTANIHHNFNQFYMAALMAAPMLIIEIMIMGSMYPNKKLNIGIAAVGMIILAASFFSIREQIAIADEQLLKSMIPHHAGAVLMCNKAQLADPEIQALCHNIVQGQQEEINWMTAKLESLDQ